MAIIHATSSWFSAVLIIHAHGPVIQVSTAGRTVPPDHDAYCFSAIKVMAARLSANIAYFAALDARWPRQVTLCNVDPDRCRGR